MQDRAEGPLINPTWDQVIERDPLVAFSFYLSGRVHVLRSIAVEIVENLDQGFNANPLDGGRIARAEALMWLWILGAYEVVRTMCQAKDCFSECAFDELSQLKKRLTEVRMPAAKMEKRGNPTPVTSDRSPAGWDLSRRDLLVNDPTEATGIYARDLLVEFERVFSSIAASDVLGHHQDAYRGKSGGS